LYIVNASTTSLHLPGTFLKEIVNGALGHTVYITYQGVFYFTNVTQFRGTRKNVISFTPIKKMGSIFTNPIHVQQLYVQISYIESLLNRTINVDSTDRSSLMSPSQAWAFTEPVNSKLLNTISGTRHVPNSNPKMTKSIQNTAQLDVRTSSPLPHSRQYTPTGSPMQPQYRLYGLAP